MSRATLRAPQQFPAEPTAFVGRAAELVQLSALLTAARLVTVTGAGGVGKTRLARRAAKQAGPGLADGAVLIELSALRDPELLTHTVAARLGLPEQDPRSRREQIVSYLSEREMLLVLDTCEHLVDACASFAAAVLAQTANVTILATSRQPLDVPGEREFSLRPLDAAGGDALDLFARRAAAAAPGFEVTDANRAQVARLCRHLDGIPLAIELAAVRLGELSLGGLTEQMDSRFRGLTGARRDDEDRHQTLRDAIGWSYDLCTPAERAVWARLSVFAGSFGVSAAERVCEASTADDAGGGLDRGAVLDALFGLVEKSVLTLADGDEPRYQMLDTLREYGAEWLAASGAESQVRARHAALYVAMAGEFGDRPLERQVPRFQALADAHADIRAALEYVATLPDTMLPDTVLADTVLAETAGTDHLATRLPVSLLWYWLIAGRMDEGRYWLTRGLARVTKPGRDRAQALFVRGYLAAYQGDGGPAIDDVEAGLALAADLGDRRLQAWGQVYLVKALTSAGRLAEARQSAETAAARLGPDDELAGLPVVLGVWSAYLSLLSGDLEGCRGGAERTLCLIPPDSGERWATGLLHGLAGLALGLQGKPGEGNERVLRGLALKHELGDSLGIALGLTAGALLAVREGRHERTAWLLGAGYRLWERLGSVFAGVSPMQALTEQAAADARAALGDVRYAELSADGEAWPLDEVVARAVADADHLPEA